MPSLKLVEAMAGLMMQTHRAAQGPLDIRAPRVGPGPPPAPVEVAAAVVRPEPLEVPVVPEPPLKGSHARRGRYNRR